MLKDKVALVTGASRGIGREIALQLAEQGAIVVVNYNGSQKAAEEVVELIHNKNSRAVAYKCDISSFEQVKEMTEHIIQEFGHIDILVNNAGITNDNLLVRMTEEQFDTVLDTNLKGTFNTCKNVIKYMVKNRAGRIINISSVSGIIGNSGQVNYSAAKAGVIGLTKSLAKEVASRNITVNAVAPGFIATDMSNKLSEKVIESVKSEIPLKRFGTPKDIADIVIYLATNEGNYITGQVFKVDGGIAI